MKASSLDTDRYRGRILEDNWDKSLQCFPPCYSQSPLLTDLIPPPPPFKLVCNGNIVYPQDNAQKPQRNYSWIRLQDDPAPKPSSATPLMLSSATPPWLTSATPPSFSKNLWKAKSEGANRVYSPAHKYVPMNHTVFFIFKGELDLKEFLTFTYHCGEFWRGQCPLGGRPECASGLFSVPISTYRLIQNIMYPNYVQILIIFKKTYAGKTFSKKL